VQGDIQLPGVDPEEVELDTLVPNAVAEQSSSTPPSPFVLGASNMIRGRELLYMCYV